MEVIIKPCGSLRDNKDLWSYFNIENISDLSELSQQMFKYNMLFGGQEIEIKYKQTSQLNEMARVGYINGELEVYVWTDDPGNIPHVHVRDTNSKGNNFETCVQLNTNEYFLHGYHKDKFNSKQKKAFAEFMEDKPLKGPYKTNYELAVSMWELNNSTAEVKVKKDYKGNVIIPDYRNMFSEPTLF